jgi:hypothetical protein
MYGSNRYVVQRYWTSEESDRGISLFTGNSENAQLDFQVEALVGHDSQKWVIEHPFAPSIGGYFTPAIGYDEKTIGAALKQ